MRRPIISLLAATSLLSACQRPSGPASVAGPAGLPVAVRKVTPSAPSSSTTATSAIVPSPAPSAPDGPKVQLTGLIKIDADYVISAGGGNVISAGGGNVISAGGGNVISAGGGNVISAGGGNVISAGGGNVISAGGGNYQVFALAASGTAAASVAPGTMLPVQGMVVAPVSLTTGKLLGIAVKTDATGTYHVTIPASEKDCIRLIAAIPGKSGDDPIVSDPRLQYSLIVAQNASAQDTLLDENSSLTTQILRTCLVHRLQEIMFSTQPDLVATLIGNWSAIPAIARTLVQSRLEALHASAEAAYPGGPPKDDEQARLAQRVVDILLAASPIDTMTINPLVAASYTKQNTDRVVPAMDRVFETIRAKVDQDLAQDPTYFDQHPEIFTGGGKLPVATLPTIRKDTDFCTFLVNDVRGSTFTSLDLILAQLGAQNGPDLEGDQLDEANYLDGATTTVIYTLLSTLIENSDTQKTVDDTIKNFHQIETDTDQVTI